MNNSSTVGIAWLFIAALSLLLLLAPALAVVLSRRATWATKLRWITYELVSFFIFGLLAFSLESNFGTKNLISSAPLGAGYLSACIVFVIFIIRNPKNRTAASSET